MYTQPIKNNRFLIPPHICKQLGITETSELSLEVQGNKLIFTVDNDNKQKRQEWINYWYDEFRSNFHARINTMNNITAVAVHGQIGISKPSRTDKYDKKTGIAVAYAKAMGDDIPDYI